MALMMTSPAVLANPVPARPAGCAGQMRPARYSISVVASLRLIRIEIGGFWDMATLRQFNAELEAIGARLRGPGPRYVILCNVSGAAIQSREILAQFEQMMAGGSETVSRFALVTDDARSRMQAKRLLSARPDAAIFDDDNAALRWLKQR